MEIFNNVDKKKTPLDAQRGNMTNATAELEKLTTAEEHSRENEDVWIEPGIDNPVLDDLHTTKWYKISHAKAKLDQR